MTMVKLNCVKRKMNKLLSSTPVENKQVCHSCWIFWFQIKICQEKN